MPKFVTEDWSFFNEAVQRRAKMAFEQKRQPEVPLLKERPRPVPPTPPPPETFSGPPRRPPVEPSGWQPVVAVLAAIAFIIFLLAALPRNPAPTGSGTTRATGTDRVVTNYTIFHSVDFRHGSVVTGWNFAHSNDPVPKEEYCYFNIPAVIGASTRFDIESRPLGGRQPYPGSTLLGLSREDWEEAATKCQWHPSSRKAR